MSYPKSYYMKFIPFQDGAENISFIYSFQKQEGKGGEERGKGRRGKREKKTHLLWLFEDVAVLKQDFF